MDIFANYIIVDEKTINNMDIKLINVKYSEREQSSNSTFIDSTPFASLKFDITISNNAPYRHLVVSDIGSGVSVSRSSEPLAQLIVWEWSQGTQFVKNKIILEKGGRTERIACPTSFVIRILKKREVIEKPCPPLSSPDDDLAVLIGKDRLVVSAHRLMSVSPMINRMLSVDMKEKQERTINLDGLGVSMEQFKDFLEAISIQFSHHPFFPNPKNVLDLLKLSDYFQVDWLKERCGVHLVNCVEISFVGRFFLVERYRLDNLKADEIESVIPARFCTEEYDEDGYLVQTEVFVGKLSKDECLEPGKSHTIRPNAYITSSKFGHKIRLIDTPSILNTGGIQVDNLNLHNTLSFISTLPELHAICILLKPNSTRSGPAF